MMLELAIATLLGSLSPETRAVTFTEAKDDPSKRMAYLEAIASKLVHDKAKNPEGIFAAWFYVADEKQMAAAQDATAWYRDSVTAGAGLKEGFLLVGDVFSLATEDELKSVIQDFAVGLAKMREAGLKVKDQELDANIPALKLVSNRSLLPLYAQAAQLEAILKGTRKVSDGFKAELVKQYLATHANFCKDFAREKKVYDDNNENTLQKEIVDFLKFDHERFETLGYQHKLVNKETQDYTLEKK